jgi:hypothetical protein
MSIKCILGFHEWNGCKCTKCNKTRDEGHELISTPSGCKCSQCGKTMTLPKLLITSPSPVGNIMVFTQYYLRDADIFMADFPAGWGVENCCVFQENPLRTTEDQMIDLAKKEWPNDVSFFPNLKITTLTLPNHFRGYACIIKQHRPKPPADKRYPEDFFPCTYEFMLGPQGAPDNLYEYLQAQRIRYGMGTDKVFYANVDSHSEIQKICSYIAKQKTHKGECYTLSFPCLCPHGRFEGYSSHFNRKNSLCPECRKG